MITIFYWLFRIKAIGDYNHDKFDFDALIRVGCFGMDIIACLLIILIWMFYQHWKYGKFTGPLSRRKYYDD